MKVLLLLCLVVGVTSKACGPSAINACPKANMIGLTSTKAYGWETGNEAFYDIGYDATVVGPCSGTGRTLNVTCFHINYADTSGTCPKVLVFVTDVKTGKSTDITNRVNGAPFSLTTTEKTGIWTYTVQNKNSLYTMSAAFSVVCSAHN
eukprot:TRINITY_DN3415_c0_g1_i1.p1 TRINITY_DN3415_c0_g1~~TRINITY_DN3415_c0_g1_i1.p1  ORF type:complete len:149 (+),score=20.72 TRINITY_DN3415_c0_g1_i1:27-473(+)